MPALKYYEGGVWKTLPIGSVSGSGGGGHTVQDETNALTQRTKLNFVGQGVTVTDDSTLDTTRVSIPAGSQAYAYGGGSVVAVPTVTFTLCPISTSGLVISSSSGVPDFEWMSDGSLRIVNEGFYEIAGALTVHDAINAANQVEGRIYSLTASGTARWETISNTLTGVAGYPTLPLARGTYLSAGTRISFHVYHTNGNSRQCSVYSFSIHRTGQGPPGPQAAIALDTWHIIDAAGEPTFAANWSSFGSVFQPVGFRKDANGRVNFRGLVVAGAAQTGSSRIFTLPAGYWPKTRVVLDVIIGTGAGYSQGRLDVQADGKVTTETALSSGNWIGFDGLSFDTETVTAMPTGPAGPKGDKGDLGQAAASAFSCGLGSVVTMAPAFTWMTAPIPSSFTADPVTAFTRNADNSITILEAGWYQVSAAVNAQAATDGVVHVALGSASGNNTLWGISSSRGDAAIFPRASISTAIQFTAGQKLYINSVSDAASLSVGLQFLTIARLGAGPKGDKGDTGATGAKGADGAFADPAYRKMVNTGAAAQTAPSAVPWVYNIAGAPYVDLTPGTWRVESGAMLQSNVPDYVALGLWNETDNTGIGYTTNDGVYVGTSAQVPLTNGRGGHILTVTKNTRMRIWVYPAGTSTGTIPASSPVPTAYMEAWLVGPGLKGDKGDTGAKGADGVAASVTMDTWHNVGAVGEPAFNLPWGNADITRRVRFRKYPDGRVQIQGVAAGGASNTPVFKLPTGYLPLAGGDHQFICSGNGGIVGCAVLIDGNVNPYNIVGNVSSFIYLDPVNFDTETVTALPTGPQGAKGDTGARGADGAAASVPIEAWRSVGTSPAFGAGFSNGTDQPLQFRKDPLGKVQLRGYVIGPSGGGLLFTLPAGYTPPANYARFPTMAFQGGAAVVGYAYVTVTGAVNLTTTSGAATTTQWDVSSIEFDTDSVTAMPTGPKGDKGDPGGNSTVPLDKWHKVSAVGEPPLTGWAGSDINFRKDPLGRVHIYGSTATGPANTAIFTLPAGYAPKMTRYFDTLRSAGAAGGYITIDTSGVVAAATIDNYIDLSYDTETVTAMPTGPKGDKGDPGASTSIALVATLPAAPYDGLEVYYLADAANGIIWHLRYRSASGSAYKWEFLGGPALTLDTNFSATINVGTPVLNSVSYTLPLGGDWSISFGGRMYSANGPGYGNVSFAVQRVRAAGAPTNLATLDFWTAVAPGLGGSTSISPSLERTSRATGLLAADVIRSYLSASGVTALIDGGWMEIVPVRVG